MLAELSHSLSNDIVMGLAQAGGAITLCLAVVLLCRRFAVHVERDHLCDRTTVERWRAGPGADPYRKVAGGEPVDHAPAGLAGAAEDEDGGVGVSGHRSIERSIGETVHS